MPASPSQGTAAREDIYRAQGYWSDATLADWLRERVETQGDEPALGEGSLREGPRRLTWRGLAAEVRAAERVFERLGIGKSDVVALQLPNILEFAVVYLAAASRGALVQTVHMPYRGAELEPLLRHSGAVAVLACTQWKDYRAADTLADLQSRLPALRHVIAVGAAWPRGLEFARLTADAMHEEQPAAPLALSGSDPFLLLYTSGTTSAPKGVPHAYRNCLANSKLTALELSVARDDVLLSAAPFTHLYGLFTLNMTLATGAASLLLPAFSPPEFSALLGSGEPTMAFTAPAHIAGCLAGRLFEGRDLSSLRCLQMSGSAVPAELARAFEPLMGGGRVAQLWGMSEIHAGAFTRPGDDAAVRMETTGRPSTGTELRVARADGALAAPGEVGELQMRGPSLFEGYLNNPAATRAAFSDDGWFRTGDLATLDDAGNTRLHGRCKDIINRGGIKFNPLDIESLMLRHPAVSEAAIVPLPDPVLGERACLCVTLRPGQTLSLEQVQQWLAGEQVTRIRWPERLHLVSAMPVTPTRKIIKAKLIEWIEQADDGAPL